MKEQRRCNGGPFGKKSCGRVATVVCTDRNGLQWFACGELEHQENARHAEPIAEWFERLEHALSRRSRAC